MTESLPPLADLDTALQRAIRRVTARTGAARASLFLRDPHTGDAVTRVSNLAEQIRVPNGEGIVGHVFSRRSACSWPDDGPEPFRPAIEATGYQPSRLTAQPVWVDGAVVGVLEVLDPSGTDPEPIRLAARDLGRLLASSSLASQLRPVGDSQVPLELHLEGIVGASPAVRDACRLVGKVADTEAAVLITGETGTGKELFAKAVHANSRRSSGPFAKVDCGALPDTLIENELFGHERGAFTGAERSEPGRVEQAHTGTLFLDEVGELSALAQTRLLRVLEDHVVQRLGGGAPRTVDFRLVAATHRDLGRMVAEGRFRADLYHRLKVVTVRLPSLRERGAADIWRLTEHFAKVHGKRHGRPVRRIPSETQELLARYPWPGNVRELAHAVESAVVLCDAGVLTPDRFDLVVGDAPAEAGPTGFADRPTVAELERRYLAWLLRVTDGDRTEVQRITGLSRSTLWRRLRDA